MPMKLTDLWKNAARPTISLEVFPARTPKAAEKLDQTIDELVALKPDFMSVTFGAGGSTRSGSLELATKLIARDQCVLAYFACYGLGPDDITQVIGDYRVAGVRNVLAVRGDIPRDQPEFAPHSRSLAHATDLLAFLRGRFDLCLGAAAYPEGHIQAPNRESDWDFLKLKVDCGAQFLIANYCYDNQRFFELLEGCQARGVRVPVIPGVMPIYSVKMMDTLASICGATIPPRVRQSLDAIPETDKEAVGAWGIEFAIQQCTELVRAGVPGLHFYTMDRSASVGPILRSLRDVH